jgi:hypothetical protein
VLIRGIRSATDVGEGGVVVPVLLVPGGLSLSSSPGY